MDRIKKELNDALALLEGYNDETSDSRNPLQLIYFGAPGTSKSTTIKKLVGKAPQHRITFHPDTDYSNFVGCYKPTKEKDSKEITYKFVAQTFIKAYCEAWKNLVNDSLEDKRVFLIIEEINRGNCAQIFGDLFQLLDRNDEGYSDYTIEPDEDLRRYLDEEAFVDNTKIPQNIRSGSLIKLPKNLYIWATMNTSDQSLFPIDSAFKRRWEWKYLPIKNDGYGHIIRVDKDRTYDWWEFLEAINARIEKLTEQEDKQLGYWFTKPNNGVEISLDRFVSKVVFYLWNDVFKDFTKDANSPFVIKDSEDKKYDLKFYNFFDEFGNAIPNAAAAFIEGLNVMPRSEPETATDSDELSTVSSETVSSELSETDVLPEDDSMVDKNNDLLNADSDSEEYSDKTIQNEGTLFDDEQNDSSAQTQTEKTGVADLLKSLYKKKK